MTTPDSSTDTAPGSSASNPRLQEIIEILNEANGKIPDGITRSDMELLINEGGSQADAIFDKIVPISIPFDITANGNDDSTGD